MCLLGTEPRVLIPDCMKLGLTESMTTDVSSVTLACVFLFSSVIFILHMRSYHTVHKQCLTLNIPTLILLLFYLLNREHLVFLHFHLNV